MKKLYLRVIPIAIAIFFLNVTAHAQYGRLKNSSSTQLGLGFTDAGIMVNAYYFKTFDQKIKAGFGGGLVFGQVKDIAYKGVFIDGVGSFAMYNNRFVSVNAVAGISFAGDFINSFPSDVYNKTFSFNYGALGGMEMEFTASRSLSFVLYANQRYYLKKDFGNWRYQLGVGFRVTL